uniref:Uncharacterized protein n=1 Tax=Romanomermis culicivorax TaxID=13658 RepID=A0A915HKF8_ROMCU
MFKQLFDPELNMDSCCCGSVRIRRGAFVVGCLELAGVLLVLGKVFLAGYLMGGHWPSLSIVAVLTLIAAFNFFTIPLMFVGLKKRRASLIAWHLIVHVVNVISLVFVLLISSTFLVVVSGDIIGQQKLLDSNETSGYFSSNASADSSVYKVRHRPKAVVTMDDATWIFQISQSPLTNAATTAAKNRAKLIGTDHNGNGAD